MLDQLRTTPDTFPAPHWAPERWRNIHRSYAPAEVARLAGSLRIEHTLATNGARRLWELLQTQDFVPTMGTYTGIQAVQQVKAGLEAIYLSGWQVAADGNSSGDMYPDQSLYPVDSVPAVVRRINKALMRADQIQTMERADGAKGPEHDYFVPIIADAEAGFGGQLNAYELTKALIEAGAAAVHFEDQLASEKKCGHLGGKVLVPTRQFVRTLNAARLAADVLGVPTIIMARTDAESARLITSDIDELDRPFISGERTQEGFYRYNGGFEAGIARAIAYAPYADLLWCETSTPSLDDARRFAEGVHRVHPGKMLAYNCSPSFNWAKHMDKAQMKTFQAELGAMGYKYQFITLAGFHNQCFTTFELARRYREDGMAAYSELQQREFAAEAQGFTATRHQREVGTSYFDAIATVLSEGMSATTAMQDSTETAQF
ncbi:isocitrate lyase [Ancylobacter rudongensis]|jgi:isocitrate lyase|uniref:Isocitrate lyase n=1 Tax=Ancylobacter rudongensis TaxID=177413 RepID=A0A1G4TGR4_9HYPH|nr:isocitrate lyase [Ancylobacter rudongensis]RTL95236.1 isocitrate lyase [Ancylobacter aquaticus]SCW80492.1 isocitrate lyase [Ancylobacter rudongensis]